MKLILLSFLTFFGVTLASGEAAAPSSTPTPEISINNENETDVLNEGSLEAIEELARRGNLPPVVGDVTGCMRNCKSAFETATDKLYYCRSSCLAQLSDPSRSLSFAAKPSDPAPNQSEKGAQPKNPSNDLSQRSATDPSGKTVNIPNHVPSVGGRSLDTQQTGKLKTVIVLCTAECKSQKPKLSAWNLAVCVKRCILDKAGRFTNKGQKIASVDANDAKNSQRDLAAKDAWSEDLGEEPVVVKREQHGLSLGDSGDLANLAKRADNVDVFYVDYCYVGCYLYNRDKTSLYNCWAGCLQSGRRVLVY